MALWGEDALESISPESRASLIRHFVRFFEEEDQAGDPVTPTLGSPVLPQRVVSHEILLQSRTFTPEPGLSDELRSGHGGQHAIIQFWDIPAGGADWDYGGVKLLGYLPHYAYQAWIPSGALDQLRDHGEVRAVVPIEPADKIQTVLRTRGASEYAHNPDGTLRLIVLAFGDVNRDHAVEVLTRYGTLTGISRRKNMFTLRAPESAIYELAAEDVVAWIQQVPSPNEDLLDQALPAVRGDHAQDPPYNLSGQGVVLAEWDSGWADVDHDDLLGRVTIGDTGGSTHDHSTHVAGIMAGNGLLSGGTLRGLAPEAEILSYTFPDLEDPNALDDEIADAISRGALVSQNSWSIIVSASPPWENCDAHGDYSAWSQRYDEIVNGVLGGRIIVVCSAGNENNDGDCPPYPWHQLSPPMSTAKNTISVGAVYSDNYLPTCFSSRGPTDDGRLKPDLVAPGDEAEDSPEPCLEGDMIRSTIPGDTYGDMAGTSMSAPMVSGTIALLSQQFDELGYEVPEPHTYKALLIQTARNLGNTGPDYTYGHGLLDAFGAVKLLERDDPNHELINVGYVTNLETDIYTMTVPPDVNRLRVTLAWDDVAGVPGAGIELVNNLGVYLYSPSSIFFDPYVLDPDNPAQPATTGWNNLDNVEVVEVFDPEPGTWRVYVNGWTVPVGSETYTLVLPFEHIDCGDDLYHDTALGEDLVCYGDGLTLARDDITLDGGGYQIWGDDSPGIDGIRIINHDGVTVENCRITGFENGIYMYSADSCTIGGGNEIYSNKYGIAMGPGADENVIAANDIYNNAERGVVLDFCYGNVIGGLSEIYNNKRSVMFTGSSFDNMVFWASIHDNAFYGVYGRGSTTAGNEINASIISDNDYGVRYWGIGINNAIQSAQFHGNNTAVFIYDTSHLDIIDCVITENTSGVLLHPNTSQIRLEDNTICDNGIDI
ncbi:MAG: S8 family serine peptidase [Candidatus Eisenbacteria sp.]|nr:S8 family serine peptidase [Candidatus Eisenbacteria bacterium]